MTRESYPGIQPHDAVRHLELNVHIIGVPEQTNLGVVLLQIVILKAYEALLLRSEPEVDDSIGKSFVVLFHDEDVILLICLGMILSSNKKKEASTRAEVSFSLFETEVSGRLLPGLINFLEEVTHVDLVVPPSVLKRFGVNVYKNSFFA